MSRAAARPPVKPKTFIVDRIIPPVGHFNDPRPLPRRPLEEGKEKVDPDSLDAVVVPRFDPMMFSMQVLIHLFWPLSICFYPSGRFPNGLRNQQLSLRNHSLFGLFIQVGPLVCWALLGLFWAFPASFKRSTVTVDEIFYIPMLMMAARIVAIGVKYATLSREELARFMNASREQAIEYTNQMQLLSGFLFLRDDVIDRELRTAAEKTGLRLELLRFQNDPNDDARSDDSPSLSFDEGETDDRDYWWDKFVGAPGDRSFDSIAKKLYRKSKDASPISLLNVFSVVVSCGVVVVPVVVRVAVGEDQIIVGDWIAMTAFGIASALTWINVYIVCLFLGVGAMHDFRRALVLKWYVRLIRMPPRDTSRDVLYSSSGKKKDHFPRVSLCHDPLDGVAWVQGRSIIGAWAFRYERRAEYYCVLVTVVLLAGLVSFFMKLFSGDHKDLLLSSRTWVLLFMILVLMATTSLSALFAAIANEQAENALALFAHRRLELQMGRTPCPVRTGEVQNAEEILAVASDQLEILNRVYDARLFGVRADGGMVLSIISFGVTFYAFVFFMLFDIDAR